MSLTYDVATKYYQLTHEQLMDIAENYQVSEEASELALVAAQEITLEFIDQKINEINALNNQYQSFINRLETTIAALERTTLERLLIDPLKRRLQQAKKESENEAHPLTWSEKLDLIFKWFQTQMGIK